MFGPASSSDRNVDLAVGQDAILTMDVFMQQWQSGRDGYRP